jgi:LysM repeat protein
MKESMYTVLDIFKRLDESPEYLFEESIRNDHIFESFYGVGRMLSEGQLTEPQILQLFADIEQGYLAQGAGANRTTLGRAKDVTVDAATQVKNALGGILAAIQRSTPVEGVDAAYDQLTDFIGTKMGGDNSKVLDSIKKYRLLAKQYPKTQLFVKTALIAMAGLATGGAGLPIIAGLTAGVDAAIKGEKLSSLIGKGAGAALLGLGAQKVNAMLAGADAGQGLPDHPSAASDYGTGTYDGQPPGGDVPLPNADAAVNAQADIDAAREWVNADDAGKEAIEQTTGMSQAQLQDIAVSNDLKPDVGGPDGVASAAGDEGGTAGQFAGGQYTVQKGDQLGFIAQANGVSVEDLRGLNPQIDFSKPLQPGMNINLPPQGDGAGSVWKGYQGNMYGDKVPGATNAPTDAASDASNSSQGDTTPTQATSTEPTVTVDNITNGIGKGSVQTPDGRSYTATIVTPDASMRPRIGSGFEQLATTVDGKAATAYLPPDGGTAYVIVKESFTRGRNSLEFAATVLPLAEMVDKRLTVFVRSLDESLGNKKHSKTYQLNSRGIDTVFENIQNYQLHITKIMEAVPGTVGPNHLALDAPGAPVTPDAQPGAVGRGLNWLDKKFGQAAGAVKNFGHQFTTKVTKEKLKMDWHQAGKPTDSLELFSFLQNKGVPYAVLNDVFSKMKLPVPGATDTTATPTADTTPTATTAPTADAPTPPTAPSGSMFSDWKKLRSEFEAFKEAGGTIPIRVKAEIGDILKTALRTVETKQNLKKKSLTEGGNEFKYADGSNATKQNASTEEAQTALGTLGKEIGMDLQKVAAGSVIYPGAETGDADSVLDPADFVKIPDGMAPKDAQNKFRELLANKLQKAGYQELPKKAVVDQPGKYYKIAGDGLTAMVSLGQEWFQVDLDIAEPGEGKFSLWSKRGEPNAPGTPKDARAKGAFRHILLTEIGRVLVSPDHPEGLGWSYKNGLIDRATKQAIPGGKDPDTIAKVLFNGNAGDLDNITAILTKFRTAHPAQYAGVIEKVNSGLVNYKTQYKMQ